MTTPCQLPGPIDEALGSDGSYSYVRCGANVYRQDGRYSWPAGSASAWPASSVARRIATAAERRQREEARIRDAMRREATLRTGNGRRVG